MSKPEDIGKLLPIGEIYKDVAQPAARQVGGALESTAKVARLLLAPIEYLAAYEERWQRYLERVAQKVPEDRRIEAPSQVVGPVLEGLRYVNEQDVIAELFVNLLARAIDSKRVSEAHPAFASIISQINTDEAQIIYRLHQRSFIRRTYSALNAQTNTFSGGQLLSDEFPVEKLIFPENYLTYIDHLHSLNLAGMWQQGNQEYVYDEESRQQIGVNINSKAQLTTFGEMFARACVPDQLPDELFEMNNQQQTADTEPNA